MRGIIDGVKDKIVDPDAFNSIIEENVIPAAESVLEGLAEQCSVSIDDIKTVVFVGGSTKIPQFAEMMKGKLSEECKQYNLPSLQGIAMGAAIYSDFCRDDSPVVSANESDTEGEPFKSASAPSKKPKAAAKSSKAEPACAPSKAPSKASAPSEAPSKASAPSEAPSKASAPSEAPSEACAPSEAPSEACAPSEAPSEACAPAEP